MIKLRTTRKLWTISQGKDIGYIESVKKTGFFWKHNEILFRHTSSNLANGVLFNISLHYMISNPKLSNLSKFMNDRKPVIINYNQQVPWKNEILGGKYI